MKPSLFLSTLIAVSLLITACSKDDDLICIPNVCGGEAVNISNSLYNNGPDDPFQLDSVWLDGSCLHIAVSYGGGCGEVTFELAAEKSVGAGNPPFRKLRLTFDDRDFCEALISEELLFQISELQVQGQNRLELELAGIDTTVIYEY